MKGVQKMNRLKLAKNENNNRCHRCCAHRRCDNANKCYSLDLARSIRAKKKQ